MKFLTFVWVNLLAIASTLLVLGLKEQELNLLCTNTNTQRSSILDGRMINIEGSVDTFGTAIVVDGTSSLEIKYSAVEQKNVGKFDVIASSDDFVLSQSNSDSRLSTFKLFRASGHWWGQLIQSEYGSGETTDVVTKVYYCG